MRRLEGKGIGLLAAVACALLGACSHSSADRGVPLVKRHAATAGTATSGGAGADGGPSDLVSAVSGAGGDGGPVGLKFQLGQRPVAGQPVLITLRLLANQPLEHLEARFHTDEGLEVTQGADFDPEGHMDAGATVDHNLTLLPDHDGVYTVMATVTTGSTAEDVSRSFVIPIVVGSRVPASSAAAAKPQAATKPRK